MLSRPASLRVLQVAATYPPYMGGVETHVLEVAPRLVRRGIATTVLTTDPRGGLPRCEDHDGVRILRVPAWPPRGDYYFAPGIYRLIARGGWDLIHCQGYHTFVAPLAMLAAVRAKIPYVVTFHSGGHSSRARNALRGVQLTLLRPLLARAKRLVAVSDFELDWFAQRLRFRHGRFVLIPNGSHLPNPEGVNRPEPATPLIVSVGRLERYKGHHRVLEAMPHVLSEYPQARLRIAGGGPYEKELRNLASRLGIEASVEIRSVPPADRQAMATLLSEASVVTSLSEYESQGLAVMEAIALRRPALVVDSSALSPLAAQGLVRAIPLRSSAAQVANAIIAQMRSPLVPARVKLPTWDECAARIAHLYRTIKDASA